MAIKDEIDIADFALRLLRREPAALAKYHQDVAQKLTECQAEIILLKELLEDARRAKSDSEDIRHGIVMATVDLARDMEKMCEQMVQWKEVVTAAQKYAATGQLGGYERDELLRAVQKLTRPA